THPGRGEHREECLRQAEEALKALRPRAEALLRLDPEDDVIASQYGLIHWCEALLKQHRGDLAAALVTQQKAAAQTGAFYENKLRRESNRVYWLAGVYHGWMESAGLFMVLEGHDEMLAALERAQKLLERLQQIEPREVRWRGRLAELHERMSTGWLVRKVQPDRPGQRQEFNRQSLEYRRREVKVRETLLGSGPGQAEQAEALAKALRQQALLHFYLREPP